MGIQHIEDLPVHEFVEAIRNLNEFHISEKVDGFNIKFGLDEQGFYTRGKGQDKFRQVSDYTNEFRYVGFKSAHKALAYVLPVLLSDNLLNIGDEIEAEVLFGDLPNTVPYNKEVNRLILLRVTQGYANLDLIKEKLEDQTVSITLKVPHTDDGKAMVHKNETHNWSFAQTPRVDPMYVADVHKKAAYEHILEELENYLLEDSGIANFSNAEILALPLNRRYSGIAKEDWTDVKNAIRAKREEIEENTRDYKLEIKEELLNKLVRSIQSAFGPDVTDGGWIEGVVLRREKENNTQLVKLVDKDLFTALNKFYWKVRDNLMDNPRDPNNIKSIIGKTKVSLANAVGHPELGTSQRKRYIKKHNLTPEKLANNIDLTTTKRKFLKILQDNENKLARYHDLYEKYKSEAFHEIDYGDFKRKFHLDDSVDKKNLQAFAELYTVLDMLKTKVNRAHTSYDLAKLVLEEPKLKEGSKVIASMLT